MEHQMFLTVTAEQLSILVREETHKSLLDLGVLPAHVSASEGWRLCKSRRKFERFVREGLIAPQDIDGYKTKRYLTKEILETNKPIRMTRIGKSKKIYLS